jgi:YjbE family integral membrane protein
MFELAQISAFIQVVLIDVTLAGDNAIVVGMAAAGLEGRERRKAVLAGIAMATLLRIGLAMVASSLLAVIGLTLAGGILLLWVAWKMARETLGARHACAAAAPCTAPKKTVAQAMLQIVVADVSMSIDNVLAVAGTARQNMWVLVSGLVLSVALMGVASTLVTRILKRMPWIVWVGLGIITYVSLHMIYDGWREVGERLF